MKSTLQKLADRQFEIAARGTGKLSERRPRLRSGSCSLCTKGHPTIWRGFDRWHSDGHEGMTTFLKCESNG